MSVHKFCLSFLVASFLLAAPAHSQVEPVSADAPAKTNESQSVEGEKPGIKEKVSNAASSAKQKVGEVAEKVNQNQKAQEVSAGILDPIYKLAGALSLPGFHWVAFMLIMAGVVSFAGQLVLGKLIMLSKAKFSLLEILNDAICLAICLVALVMTTQAAAENSEFTRQPAMVLSATIVGVILGIVLMRRGVGQEVRAARGS